MKNKLKKILEKINVNADWIGIREVNEFQNYRTAKNGSVQSNVNFLDSGLMIEVMTNGCIGYAATNGRSTIEIQECAEKALKLAKVTSEYSTTSNTHNEIRPPSTGKHKTVMKRPLNSWTAGDYNTFLIDITKNLKTSDKVIAANTTLFTVERETNYVSTSGADISQVNNLISIDYGLTVQDGDSPQTRTNGHQVYQGGLEYLNEDEIKLNCKKISEEAHILAKAKNCPSETMDIIIDPGQMVLQIHESIGHPLELDRILGDEKNYAGHSFVKLTDFGKLKYGTPLLNITFDPTVRDELASYWFDDIGTPATREFLIKDGILLRPIGGLESQKTADLPGVACSRVTSWNRPPIDRMANINLLPGTTALNEMISNTKKGIYVQANRSWSIDDNRNKFQFGCEYGQLIENGKLTKVVKNPNYRGISSSFWNSLKAVGNKECTKNLGSYFCGKGEPNQLIRVGHMAPTCLFENVEVFGGV